MRGAAYAALLGAALFTGCWRTSSNIQGWNDWKLEIPYGGQRLAEFGYGPPSSYVVNKHKYKLTAQFVDQMLRGGPVKVNSLLVFDSGGKLAGIELVIDTEHMQPIADVPTPPRVPATGKPDEVATPDATLMAIKLRDYMLARHRRALVKQDMLRGKEPPASGQTYMTDSDGDAALIVWRPELAMLVIGTREFMSDFIAEHRAK